MFKKIINWTKSIIIKYAIKLLKAEIEKVEATNADLRDFRYNLYRNSTTGFISWGMNKLEDGSGIITPIQLVKKRLEPMRDDIEGVIVKVIDGLEV